MSRSAFSKTRSLFAVMAATATLSCSEDPNESPPESQSATTSQELRRPDPAFEVQSYVLPNGQGYRHMTAYVDERRNELVVYGGLGNGGPMAPTPMNHDVFTLDLNQPPSARDWLRHEIPEAERKVKAPWFTSTRGFIELGGRYYLACDDTDDDTIYSYNPRTYRFDYLTGSTLPVERRAGDCCAVGVTIPGDCRGGRNNRDEERIYIVGGRNEFATPSKGVRYYSITYGRWEQVADLNAGRSHLGCAAVEQHNQPLIYAVGGGDQVQGLALRSMEVYDVLRNRWTLYPDYLPEGRTRQAIQNIDDKYLLLIGGDVSCAGGGNPNLCRGDGPVTTVQVVDIKRGNRLLTAPQYSIPQLVKPRATPATAVRKHRNLYELYVIGGRTTGTTGLAVETSTEVMTFDTRSWER